MKLLNEFFIIMLLFVALCTDAFATTQQSDSMRILSLKKDILLHQDKNPAQAIAYIEAAINICNQKGSAFFIDTHMELLKQAGIVSQKASDYSKALSYYITALRTIEKFGRTNSIIYASTLNSTGTCYLAINQVEEGKKYIKEAIEVATKAGFAKEASSFYNNLGLVAKNQGNWNQAIIYYSQAIKNGQKSASPYANLGLAYFHLKKYNDAEYYLLKALALSENDAYNKVLCYSDLGSLYTETGRYKEAELNFNYAAQYAGKYGIGTAYQRLYENMIGLYEKQNDYKRVSEYQKKLLLVKDSIYKETNTKQINELRAGYELDKKAQEISLLNQKKETAEARVEKEQITKYFMLAIASFILFTGLVVSRNIFLKQKVKNKALSEHKTMIENDNLKLLHENAAIRYEVLKNKTNPHFLFNSLYTLTAIVLRDQQQAVEYIERFSELYRMILATNDQTTITLEEEIRLVEHYLYLQKMRFGDKLITEISVTGDPLRYKLPPFSIQMAAENAIKHNSITRLRKLTLRIYTDDEFIYIVNNLQKTTSYTESTYTGQKSITQRFLLITKTAPVFEETATEYIVKLPLVEQLTNVTA